MTGFDIEDDRHCLDRGIQNCRRLHPAAEKGWPARYRDVSITSIESMCLTGLPNRRLALAIEGSCVTT